jgi:transposase
MSLKPQAIADIPEDTARIARAAFPKGNLYLKIRDSFGTFFIDEQFADLFPTRGQPAEAPWRLALVTLFQYIEDLSDRQAADAVRSRLDWKYALGLELTDPGFDFSVLCQFRQRLLDGNAEEKLLQVLLDAFTEKGLLKAGGRQRTDSTHVLAAVRTFNRLEKVGQTLVATLESLAVVAPDWLVSVVPADWFLRYGRRVENFRLPREEKERQAWATQVGVDGFALLAAINAAEELPYLKEIPMVQTLRQVCAEQFEPPQSGSGNPPRFKAVRELPPASEQVVSPYDTEARFATKQGMSWAGYKIHVTETCDVERPRLLTHVETTPASTPDENMVETIHPKLKEKQLLPGEHLVDSGYTDAGVLANSQKVFGVDVIGPVAKDGSWQAREGSGFDKSRFVVDWERKVVTCPAGKESLSWYDNRDCSKYGMYQVRFAKVDCFSCAFKSQCSRATKEPRQMMLPSREEYEALQRGRERQQTEAFTAVYRLRAGIEATHGQAVQRCGLRQCRYLGLAKTHLQHLATAAAVNLVRVWEWLCEREPAKTRVTRFARLAPA